MSETRGNKRRSIATRTGDGGETSLLYGQRVPKSHPQVEACGSVDELSASLSLVKATCDSEACRARFETIQRELIALMGEVSVARGDLGRYEGSAFPKIGPDHLDRLDRECSELEAAAGDRLAGWALPGANLHEASLEVARATARRAERRLVALRESGFPVRPLLIAYLNRLSDWLWLRARQTGERPGG